MAEPLRQELVFDATRGVAQLRQLDAQVLRSAREVDTVERRVFRSLLRIEAARRDARSLEDIAERASRRLGRQLARTAGVLIVGEVASEIGVPEAAQPIMHVGLAALGGAQFGGPIGAATFASVALVMEVVRGLRREAQEREALRTAFLQFRQEQREKAAADKQEQAIRDRKLEQELHELREKARNEVRTFYHEALISEAKDAG